MRGIGVLEDGFVFTGQDLDRGVPRFWWGRRKRAAYDTALARRGMGRKGRDDRAESDTGSSSSSSGTVAAAAYLLSETAEKKTEGGGSWGDGGSSNGDGGSSDGGGGSDGGGSGE